MPQVELHTSKGVIVIELDDEKAPRSVKNFLNYVEQQYFDGLIFHRVLKDSLIQTGAHTPNLAYYETDPPIRNEATNGLKNLRGTIGMARGSDPHSADSQWFINLDDNEGFDHSARTLDLYG
ncbi:MAG: peptidylprolyl isomerase, partial [Gammaproteobacteria bacterium]|nr:peptidylprolyl isomerase [Gammaproteobacteria bacterium]